MPNSMHRHRAGIAQTPLPVQRQSVAHRFNVIVCRFFAESRVGEIDGLVEQAAQDVLGQRDELGRHQGFSVHFISPFRLDRAILACGWGFLNSHFPSPINLSLVSA